MSTENRYIRIEDWEGNVYYPDSSSGKNTTAGEIINPSDASSETGSTTYTEGEIVNDVDSSEGKAIRVPSDKLNDTILLLSSYFDIPLGDVCVNIRAKVSSLGSGNTPVMKVSTYYYFGKDPSFGLPILLEEKEFTGNDFSEANVYKNITFNTSFSRPQYAGSESADRLFKIEIRNVGGNGINLYIDHLAVAMAMPSSSKGRSSGDAKFISIISKKTGTTDIEDINGYYTEHGLVPVIGDIVSIMRTVGTNVRYTSYMYTGSTFTALADNETQRLDDLLAQLDGKAAYKSIATTISSSSTDDEVPTAKTVKNYVSSMGGGEAAKKDVVTSLSDTTTSEDLPTAKAVATYVKGVRSQIPEVGTAAAKNSEDTLNKTSSNLPTSKAVADYISNTINVTYEQDDANKIYSIKFDF